MRQSHKMVKYTQTIRRQFADELFLSVFDHLAGLALKGLIWKMLKYFNVRINFVKLIFHDDWFFVINWIFYFYLLTLPSLFVGMGLISFLNKFHHWFQGFNPLLCTGEYFSFIFGLGKGR